MARDDDGTMTAVVVVGGAALLLLLLRLGAGGAAGGRLSLMSALGGSRRTGDGSVGGAGAAPPRCKLRLSAQGLTLDGTPISADEAARRCAEVDLVVTGDARQGALDEVRAALAARRRKVNEKLPGVAKPTGIAFALSPARWGPR